MAATLQKYNQFHVFTYSIMSYPEISKGLGKLTPDLWARLMAMLRDYESNASGVVRRGVAAPHVGSPYFMAKLTACTAVSGAIRWSYTFTEVYSNGSTFVAADNAQTGTAYNLCEMSNAGDYVGTGVDMGGADYPDGFNMMPIGMTANTFDPATGTYGTLDVDVVVMMFNVRDADGAQARVFFAANSHDGECDE